MPTPELNAALEVFRCKFREDLRCELQEVKNAIRDVKLELLSTQEDFRAEETLVSKFASLQNSMNADHAQSRTFSSNYSKGSKGGSAQRDGLEESGQSVPAGAQPEARPGAYLVGGNGYKSDMEIQSKYSTVLQTDSQDQIEGLLSEQAPTKWRRQWKNRPDSIPDDRWSDKTFKEFIRSSQFECIAGVLVGLNMLFIGLDADVHCRWKLHPPEQILALLALGDFIFAVLFLIEWCLRLFAYRCDFFVQKDAWKWNIFDTVITLFLVIEQVLLLCPTSKLIAGHMGAIQMMRVLRVIRICRLLRLVGDLAVLVQSIVESVKSLTWSFTFMFGTLYGFSIFLTQRILLATDGDMGPNLSRYFDSITRTCLTLLECMLGGVDWDTPLHFLFQEADAISGGVFVTFNLIGLFVLVNLVSGEFLERSMKAAGALEDKNIAEDLALALGLSDAKQIKYRETMLSFEQFQDKMQHNALQCYFQSIDLPVDDAHLRKFFNLMDQDGGGVIDAAEVYDACLRLRSPVRLVDIALQFADHVDLLAPHAEALASLQQHVNSIGRHLKIKKSHSMGFKESRSIVL